MQEIKHTPPAKEQNRFNWIASITLLSLTLFSIGGLYAYSFIQANTIFDLQSDIIQLNTDIQTASTDKNIIIANIVQSTTIRPTMDLAGIVDSFNNTATWAGIRLQGFAVRDDILTTTLIASQDGNGRDPIETIIAMMRTKNTKTGLLLDPIFTIRGSSTERTTGVSFRILSTKPNTNANK